MYDKVYSCIIKIIMKLLVILPVCHRQADERRLTRMFEVLCHSERFVRNGGIYVEVRRKE